MAADDLDALRAALGSRPLTLIGRGFGATLGAVYADRYPGRVAAAVLDAPADPLDAADARAAAIAVAAEKALDALRRRLPDVRRRLPARRRPAGHGRQRGQHPGRAPGAARGPAGQRRQVLLTLLLRLGDPTAGRSWRRRWRRPPGQRAADRRPARPNRWVWTRPSELAGCRTDLRLQRQRPADLPGPADRRRRGGPRRRRRCSARTRSAWSASAARGRRRKARSARSRPPAPRRSW